MKTPLIGMTLEQLRGVAAEIGLRPFAAGQMARWLWMLLDSIRSASSLDNRA